MLVKEPGLVLLFQNPRKTMLNFSILFQLYNSKDKGENSNPWEMVTNEVMSSKLPFQTGTLRHKLNFKTVFDNDGTATTNQGEWITVDYIFYSSNYSSQTDSLEENYLKLLAKWRLPTIEKCEKVIRTIPNNVYGSDHFSLAAKFLILPVK